MDIGRPLIFIPVVIFCLYSFYSFRKSKQNIYLIFAALAWYGAIYSGKLNIYKAFGEPQKSILDFITILVFVVMFIPYLKQSIKEYKEYKSKSQ